MTYQVNTEKVIGRPASDVFRALKEGRLFFNCGADSNTMKIDFRVGGKYQIDFRNHSLTNFGEFLEIIPDKKIVFTWCQAFGADQKPDTQVTIDLFADGAKTRLVLVHTGFKTQDVADNHQKGWNGGATDFADEIQNGRLRLVRSFATPVEKLYEACSNPASFFAFMGDISRGSIESKIGGRYQVPTKTGEIKGEFLEIVPNKKISLSWLVGCSGPITGSKVTLNFNPKDDGTSSLELIHEGLDSEKDQKAHRQGWESVTQKLSQTLNGRTQ
jgi:uncharacterized protein YndB with AHSA1/START domain